MIPYDTFSKLSGPKVLDLTVMSNRYIQDIIFRKVDPMPSFLSRTKENNVSRCKNEILDLCNKLTTN